MRVAFGFGNGEQTVNIPDINCLGVLEENEIPPVRESEAEILNRALDFPIDSLCIEDIVKPGEKIVIITSDKSRPMPTDCVLPHLLDRLHQSGVSFKDVTLVFALGSHPPQTEEERRALAGERAWKEIACIDSDLNDCILLGHTHRGSPVEIMRVVAEADRRICLGNIEYHYFAGYSGGAKAIFPGVASHKTIQANHRRMTEDAACAGCLTGNPVREDLEEGAAFCRADFILNVVLDGHKRIVGAFAGDVTSAHRAGCAFVDRLFGVSIDRRADIVLVSQGGAPKDLNLYQTQKALDNARHAVKDGGIIILIGSCKEGLGSKTFEEWLVTAENSKSLIERIGRDFRLGGHKAAAIAMVLENADIFLVSELDEALVRRTFMVPFSTVQKAFDAALSRKGKEATVWAMPCGGSTLPRLFKNSENTTQ
jgi:nickel-dependent lactate racemase